MQKILSVKEVVSSAVQVMPQAALAWTGVCFTLQVSLQYSDIFQKLSVTLKDIHQPYNREQGESRWTGPYHQ